MKKLFYSIVLILVGFLLNPLIETFVEISTRESRKMESYDYKLSDDATSFVLNYMNAYEEGFVEKMKYMQKDSCNDMAINTADIRVVKLIANKLTEKEAEFEVLYNVINDKKETQFSQLLIIYLEYVEDRWYIEKIDLNL